MSRNFLFTSESVCEGHPDKLCDQVSDAVLDACLEQDKYSRVACESASKTGMVMVFGEITTKAVIDYNKVVKATLARIGYDDEDKGLNYNGCNILVCLEKQQNEIQHAVDSEKEEELGAGDQGIMFGYAANETKELMPASHLIACKLSERLEFVRKEGILDWVLPDGKTQVTMEYQRDNGKIHPVKVHTILVSAQHTEDVSQEKIREDILEHVVKPVVPKEYFHDDIIYHINPSGSFHIGGPHGDAGLTGRKIIVDTYGGWGAHGGGAFSGKDCTKVDRSATYAARWIAKSLVHAGLCARVLVQLSYGIGIAHPLSVNVDTYNTGTVTDEKVLQVIEDNFDLRPGMIIRELELRKPKFLKTASHGHFGKDHNGPNFDPDFTWEIPKKLAIRE